MIPITKSEKNQVEPSTLYLIATPIGNLEDLSIRAAKILGGVNFIAAEDTRVTSKLLHYLDLEKELVSYHEHNKVSSGEIIAERLEHGESCALVTDAGTPAISDPGEDIVKLCVMRRIRIVPVPGACAAITALSASGVDTAHFYFEGFLPSKGNDRNKRLDKIASIPCSLIFYEAPHRINDTLKSLAERFPERRLSLCRELTKLNEEILRGTTSEISAIAQAKELRGEFVLVLEGASESNYELNSQEEIENQVRNAYHDLKNDGITKSEASKRIANDLKIPKNKVYAILLKL